MGALGLALVYKWGADSDKVQRNSSVGIANFRNCLNEYIHKLEDRGVIKVLFGFEYHYFEEFVNHFPETQIDEQIKIKGH